MHSKDTSKLDFSLHGLRITNWLPNSPKGDQEEFVHFSLQCFGFMDFNIAMVF